MQVSHPGQQDKAGGEEIRGVSRKKPPSLDEEAGLS